MYDEKITTSTQSYFDYFNLLFERNCAYNNTIFAMLPDIILFTNTHEM